MVKEKNGTKAKVGVLLVITLTILAMMYGVWGTASEAKEEAAVAKTIAELTADQHVQTIQRVDRRLDGIEKDVKTLLRR